MKNILSIDLDFIWSGTETIYQNPDKDINYNRLIFCKKLSSINRRDLKISLDHHEMCQYIDMYTSPVMIDHIDAHHDVYGSDYKIWSNPLFIRGKHLTIGNFIFQLIREQKIRKMNWLLPAIEFRNDYIEEIRNNIGPYYSKIISLFNYENYSLLETYDLVFISISPEWIPQSDVKVIESVVHDFDSSDFWENELLKKIVVRWGLKDDARLINKDRFKFSYNYRIKA